MKIGIDVGALCGKESGNKIFGLNIIKALMNKDKKNNYILYSFCKKRNNLKLNKNFTYKNLQPKYFWTKGALRFEQIINKTDIFLGLNQAFPNSSSKKIIFSHGLSFIYFKNLYAENYKRLNSQLNKMLKESDQIIVSSVKVKNEIEKVYSKSKNIKVLNYGIPDDFLTTQKVKKKKYFLNVGNNHPIKNIKLLIKIFNNFRIQKDKDYKLYLVTDRKYTFIKDKNVIQLTKASRKTLKKLYLYAKGYLTTSSYESFNLPILEALSQNTPVVALKSAYIPEMKRYINTAQTPTEFINQMVYLSNSKSKIDILELKRVFSWTKYVEELIKMY
ncbi:MAG: glycosyltransferase [bacterium]|nr:glycosyltransferase [bacterium]